MPCEVSGLGQNRRTGFKAKTAKDMFRPIYETPHESAPRSNTKTASAATSKAPPPVSQMNNNSKNTSPQRRQGIVRKPLTGAWCQLAANKLILPIVGAIEGILPTSVSCCG